VERFGRPAEEVAAPQALRTSGCVLIADISGYTKRAAKLSAPGAGGAEAVQELVNGLFAPCVDAIVDAGGDVVCFAGDAIIAWWPGEMNAALAQRAGLNVLQVTAANPIAQQNNVAIRCALVSDEYWLAAVGNQSRRLPLLGGAGFALLSKYLQKTAAGSLRMCENSQRQIAAQSDDTKQYRPDSLASQPPISDGLTEAQRNAFLPDILRDSSLPHAGAWLAEMRQTSIVFVSLCGGHEQQPAVQQLQRDAGAICDTAESCGGLVNQLVVDDKGLVAVIVFGVAGHVHENDPVRAVRFGITLSSALSSCRIGISTGRVFVGQRGTPRRCDLAVIGHPVNHAARLMNVGSNIAVDAATAKASREHFEFYSLPEVRLKGLVDSAAFTPSLESSSRPETASGTDSLLLGRNTELEQFRAVARAYADRQAGGIWLISGEPGVGKTALLRQFRRTLEDVGVNVLSGQADAIAQTTPWLAWRGVARGLLDSQRVLSGQLSVSEVIAQLHQSLPDTPPATLASLNPLLPVDLPESQSLRQLQPEARGDLELELLVNWLAYNPGQPLALIMEDLHWIDERSRAAIFHVCQALPNLLVVLTCRTNTEAMAEAQQQLTPTQLALDTLDLGSTTALLEHELGVRALPTELAQLVQQHTGGHPLFTQQLAGSLRDHPAVIRSIS